MNLERISEIRLRSGLRIYCENRQWRIEPPAFARGGWLGSARYETIEKAIEAAEYLDPYVEALFQIGLVASDVRQRFMSESMHVFSDSRSQ